MNDRFGDIMVVLRLQQWKREVDTRMTLAALITTAVIYFWWLLSECCQQVQGPLNDPLADFDPQQFVRFVD